MTNKRMNAYVIVSAIFLCETLLSSPDLNPKYLGITGYTSVGNNGEISSIGVVSPNFYSAKDNDIAYFSLSAYTSIANIKFKNVLSDSSSTLKNSYRSEMFSFGAQFACYPENTGLTPYLKLGVSFLNPDNDLSSKKNAGMQLGLGFEFPIFRNPKSNLKLTLALEGLTYSFFRKAEKLRGEPDLFNGHSLGFGIKLLL